MVAGYQVRVYSTSGALQAVLDRFRSIQIEHRINTPSTLTLGLYELDATVAAGYFTLDAIIEVRRRDTAAGLDWYAEFVGFHRTPQRQITTDNNRIFTSYCRGLLDLIARRSILYWADTDGSAKGPAPADDVIKDYVRENAGLLALTSNRRVQNAVTPGLTVQANASQALTYEGANAWKGLLDAITEIGKPHSVDFDVVWGGPTAAATFEFRTYYPHKGTDRRSGSPSRVPMVFAPDLGNMANPSYTQSRTAEATVCAVLGPGEGPLRDITIRTSPAYAESPWNFIETTLEQSNEDRQHALEDAGDKALFDKRASVNVTFDIIQTPQSAYGKHYLVGDMVTTHFSNVTVDVKIVAATILLSADGNERITLDLEEMTT